MSKFVLLPNIPSPIPEGTFVHANDMNMGQSMRRVASAYNYVSGHQRRQVMSLALRSVTNPATASENHHYFVFRTGENVESIDCIMGLRAASPGNSSSAYCEMVLYDGTNTLTSSEMHYSLAGSVPPVQWARASITAADGLLPNTLYRGHFAQSNYIRIKAASVFETGSGVTDSSVTGVSDPLNWETHKPITDSAVQDIAEAGDKLWKHNGLHLFNWTRHTEATAPTVTGTTAVNLLDTTVTAWSATSPGFVLNTEYLGSYNGDVNVELGILGERTSASSLDSLSVSIVRNGSTIISETGLLTGDMDPFSASTHSITARASDKVDIHISASSGSTWRLDAIGLWLYEA